MTGYSRRQLRQATREALERRVIEYGDPEVRARAAEMSGSYVEYI